MRHLLLTACVILAATSVQAQPALVGLWQFDEGSGDSTADTSGQDNHGTVVGAQWVWRGADGFGLRFDGDDVVVIGDHAGLEPATFTVGACVRHQGPPPSYGYVLSEGVETCYCASYSIFVGGSDLYFYTCDGSSISLSNGVSPNEIWNGGWHHVAGTYDGDFVQLYLDGQPVGSPNAAVAPNYSLSTHSDFLIGHDLPTQCPGLGGFVGGIDKVTVWDGVLSQPEIEALAECEPFFHDDFETGDTSIWSVFCEGCPGASFTFSVQPDGRTVDFFNSSSGSPPLNYYWDFGDGSLPPYRFDENPTHTYTTGPGDYNVTLTVTNPLGTDWTTRQVTITN